MMQNKGIEFSIEKMDLSHLDRVLAIEKKCFGDPWSRQMFEREIFSPIARYIVAVDKEGNIYGYAGIITIFDTAEITNIAVDPNFRGYGIGRALMKNLLENITKEVDKAYLEVRSSNTPAINLYEKFGFVRVGVRRNYYDNPPEDAILMTKIIKE